jgi:hypothetical protein
MADKFTNNQIITHIQLNDMQEGTVENQFAIPVDSSGDVVSNSGSIIIKQTDAPSGGNLYIKPNENATSGNKEIKFKPVDSLLLNQDDFSNSFLVGGTGDSIILTSNGDPCNEKPSIILFEIAYDNTGNVTINIDGLGSTPIKYMDGNDIVPGDLTSGYLFLGIYMEDSYFWANYLNKDISYFANRNATDIGYTPDGYLLGKSSLTTNKMYLAGDGLWYRIKSSTTSPYTHDTTDTPDLNYMEEVTLKSVDEKVEALNTLIFLNGYTLTVVE